MEKTKQILTVHIRPQDNFVQRAAFLDLLDRLKCKKQTFVSRVIRQSCPSSRRIAWIHFFLSEGWFGNSKKDTFSPFGDFTPFWLHSRTQQWEGIAKMTNSTLNVYKFITRATCGRPSLGLPFRQYVYLSFYHVAFGKITQKSLGIAFCTELEDYWVKDVVQWTSCCV